MKLLFISNLYPPYVLGGYEILCAQVAEGLAARGHRVEVLTSAPDQGAGEGPPPPAGNNPRVSYQLPLYAPFDRPAGRLPLARWLNLEAAGRIAFNEIRRIRPELVMVWSQLRLGLGPARQAQQARLPVVYTFNDEHPAGYLPLPLSASPKRWLSWLLDRSIFRSATTWNLDLSHTTCISQLLKDNLLKAGLPIAQSRVIHQGIPIADFPCKDKPGSLSSPVRFLYVGQLHPYKGVHVLIDAAHRLDAELGADKLKVSIAGDGPPEYREQLERLAGQGPVSVDFLGRVQREKLPGLYRSHDIFIFPSIWPEPFGLTHLEAMASGLPLIATNNGGQAEMLSQGKNALLIPPDEPVALAGAMGRILEDPELAARLARAGRRTVEEGYTLDAYLDRLEAFLLQCLEPPK